MKAMRLTTSELQRFNGDNNSTTLIRLPGALG